MNLVPLLVDDIFYPVYTWNKLKILKKKKKTTRVNPVSGGTLSERQKSPLEEQLPVGVCLTAAPQVLVPQNWDLYIVRILVICWVTI